MDDRKGSGDGNTNIKDRSINSQYGKFRTSKQELD